MKLGAGSVLHAMDRPRAAARTKADVVGRMPIARGDDLRSGFFGRLDPAIEHRHDLVAFVHRQCPAGTKVVLHIDEDQRIARAKFRRIRS